ncbi:hypothetical protein IMSAGC019_00108 [Lachnospiraceae bacterium]|nr:hypothetical protein IMSAGC019_00108 [Lachnospiraceae bacterium]
MVARQIIKKSQMVYAGFTKEEWDSKTREEKDEIKVMLKEKYPISSSQNSGSASVIILNIYKYGYQR